MNDLDRKLVKFGAGMTDQEKIDLKFIIDQPAETDFFNTHSPVATAITRSIIANPSLKIIGLLGRWGSGKSTIVREVADQLKRADTKYLTFNYDAWLHQNDPLRRSFLESLVRFLADKELIDAEDWNKKIKKLSGSLEVVDTYETPIVTPEAKLFFLCASAIAIGLSLLSQETFEDGLGYTVTRAGIWTLRLGLALVVGPLLFWIVRTLALKLRGKDASLFPALIFNKDFSHKNIQTHKQIDPTSIEFGQSFRNLMKEVNAKNVRIVIVIDNIDRIDEDEAMQIWANARSFFLSSHDDNNLDSEIYHPTVILPIDGQSISQMFSLGADKEHGERLARSFINKTFDVTFDVPAPVMSDWKRYLLDRMKYCLGFAYTEERYFRTRQFLEAWFEATSTPITPREINKALNRIVALLLQWNESTIPFETISYYSINRDQISDRIAAEVTKQDHPLQRFSTDWARELAALHFGVSVELAAQVLMTKPINEAILKNRPDLLEPYRKVSGFGDIFEQVTSNLPADEGRPAPNIEIITNAASLLSQEPVSEVWCTSAWKNLVDAFNSIDGSRPPKNLAERVMPFFDRVTEDDAGAFVSAIERIVDPLLSADKVSEGTVANAGVLGARTVEFAKRMGVRLPTFDVTGDAFKYVQRLTSLASSREAQERVRTNAPQSDVVDELVRRITDPVEAPTVSMLVSILTSPAGTLMLRSALASVESIATGAETAARGHSGDSTIFRAAIDTLAACTRYQKEHRSALERLGQDGTFASQLSAVAGSNLDDDDQALAVMVATLVWTKTGFSSPVGSSWSSFVEKFPAAPGEVNRILDEFFADDLPIEVMRTSYEANYKTRNLITYLMDDRVRRRKLGRLNSGKILGNLYLYSRMMHWTLRNKFAEQLTSYENFWPNIKNLPWNQSMFETATLLAKQGGQAATRIKSELRDRIQKTSEAEWLAALDKGIEPYKTATTFMDAVDLKLGVNSQLSLALSSGANKAATDRQMRARWFEFAEILSAPGRRKVMEAMGLVVLEISAADKLRLLKAGGTRFFAEAGFVKHPNEVVERLIIPLAKSEKGRSWLNDRSTQMRPLVEASTGSSKDKLLRLVEKLAKSTNEDHRHWGEITSKAWGIKR